MVDGLHHGRRSPDIAFCLSLTAKAACHTSTSTICDRACSGKSYVVLIVAVVGAHIDGALIHDVADNDDAVKLSF